MLLLLYQTLHHSLIVTRIPSRWRNARHQHDPSTLTLQLSYCLMAYLQLCKSYMNREREPSSASGLLTLIKLLGEQFTVSGCLPANVQYHTSISLDYITETDSQVRVSICFHIQQFRISDMLVWKVNLLELYNEKFNRPTYPKSNIHEKERTISQRQNSVEKT